MKGSLKVDNPITNKIDRYKIWVSLFLKIIIGAENKDHGMYA